MANFPTTLDTTTTLPTESASTPLSTNHITAHTNLADAVIALETKVGVDSSAVTTTLDYKLKNTASVDPGHHHTNSTLDGIAMSKVTGTLGLSQGGTNTDLSATGGTSKVLKQTSTGAAITVSVVSDSDLSVTDITTNNVTTAAHGFTPKAPNDTTKFLRGDATWSVLSAVTYKNGTTTKNVADASTTQTIAHGLGTTPKFVRITAILQTTAGAFKQSISVYNGTTQSSISAYGPNNAALTTDNTFRVGTNDNTVSAYQSGVITFDATNISIAWTLTSTPIGTAQILWEAQA